MQQVNGFQVHRHNETRIQETLRTIIDKGQFSVVIEQNKTERGVMVSVAITPAGHFEVAATERTLQLDDAAVGLPKIEPDAQDKNTLFVTLPSAGIELRMEKAGLAVDVLDRDWQETLESLWATPEDLSDLDGGATFVKRQRRFAYDE